MHGGMAYLPDPRDNPMYPRYGYGGAGSHQLPWSFDAMRDAFREMEGIDPVSYQFNYSRNTVEISFHTGRYGEYTLSHIDALIKETRYRRDRMKMSIDYGRIDPRMMLGIDYGIKAYDNVADAARHAYKAVAEVLHRCESCKTDTKVKHELDHHGFCQKTAKVFWGKVRKLYWHRHLKEKSV